MEAQLIRIVAAVIVNDEGRVLLVRKRGTTAFMQPGGKRSEGESDLETLAREIEEELGCTVELTSARPLGQFSAVAANEADAVVEASLYAVSLRGEPIARAEIAELLWLDPADPTPPPLAPLTALHVMPALSRSAS